MATSFADREVARFRRDVRRWLGTAAPRFAVPADATEERELDLRRAWEREVHRAGFSCLSWRMEHGGRGLGPIEEFVFSEECAEAGAPEGLGRVGRLLAGPAIFGHGDARLRDRFLPRIVEGVDIWCQGFSEPSAGSDLAAVRTTAQREAGCYRVVGRKLWTSFAHYADLCLLLARTSPSEDRHDGLTMLCLPMRQAGVSVRRVRQITGRSEFAEILFEGAEVPVEQRIGDEGGGWAIAMSVLGSERGAGFAALALKTMGDDLRVLRHCVPQGELDSDLGPGTRFQLLRWQAMRAIETTAGGRDALASTSILKLVWSELVQEIVRRGFESGCREHEARWRDRLLDARETTIASGTSEIQRTIIGDRVLGLPR